MHVPERRCVACGTRRPKRELARFVARADGGEHVLTRDDGSRHGGRGIYVCRTSACFERARTRRAFARGARLGENALEVDPALGAGLSDQ